MMFLLLCQQKLQGEFCHDMFHAKILCHNIRCSSVWNPQSSAQFSHGQLPILVDCSPYTFNMLRGSACCRPSRTWITFNRFLTTFESFVPHFYWCCTHCIIPESLLNHPNSFYRGMFKLNAKFIALLSHFEQDSHTVHMLTQWCLPPPLTSTAKSSLFTHVHSSPLSLAARLHQSRTNCSHYINNGWTLYTYALYPCILESQYIWIKRITFVSVFEV